MKLQSLTKEEIEQLIEAYKQDYKGKELQEGSIKIYLSGLEGQTIDEVKADIPKYAYMFAWNKYTTHAIQLGVRFALCKYFLAQKG